MKKFFILFLALLFLLVGCSYNNNSNTINNRVFSSLPVNNTSNNEYEEIEIATFTTNILDKDSSRQNNIKLACSQLNNTIVKKGETFSFCDTLGPATPEAGYQKADSFDANGNLYKEYGGGKCQVSSTLYNAVLSNSNFEIIERHAHSGKVYYVEPDKDAAVAHGSVDFKFKNNNPFDIRIKASTDSEVVTISLEKI